MATLPWSVVSTVSLSLVPLQPSLMLLPPWPTPVPCCTGVKPSAACAPKAASAAAAEVAPVPPEDRPRGLTGKVKTPAGDTFQATTSATAPLAAPLAPMWKLTPGLPSERTHQA